MQKIYVVAATFIVFINCTPKAEKEISAPHDVSGKIVYSLSIADSFYISVQLPEDYNSSTSTYPVVFMTDANFQFPMLAATVKQYEKGGLLPPLILVGIGYKSFRLMDSLRVRDYLYPEALPSDEMHAPGGGKKFYEFITGDLVPLIDSTYRTDTTNRSIAGHSFGGYFTLYTLLNQLENNRTDFANFVSASPSLWYHDFYLNRLTEKLKNRSTTNKLGIFMSAGSLENETWNITPVKNLADQIQKAGLKDINLHAVIFNELDHMDVAQLTFIKGLQQFYTTR